LKLIDSLDISDRYIDEKISAAAISNNKTSIATSFISDFTVQLRKMATFKDKEFISFKDKEVIIFSGHTATVRSIIFRPDDLQLATASDDKSIKLWDILSRNCTLTFSEHASSLDKILYNSKGTELVSCSVDSIIKVWNIASGNVLTSIDSHQRFITSLVSQSEHKIFSGSADKSLKIWDYSSGNMIKSFDNLPGVVTSIAVSSNGSHIIYAISNVKDGEYNSTIKIMDDKEYKELCSLDIKGVVLQLTHLNGNEDQILICVKHNDDDSRYEYMLYSFGRELKLLSKVEYHIKVKPDSNMKPTEQTSFIQKTLPGNNEALKEPDSSSSSSSSSAHSNTDIYSKIAINSFELNDLNFYSLFLAKNIENEISTPDVLENIAFYLKSHQMSFHLNHNQPSTIQSNNLHPLVWENIQESSFDIKIDTATNTASASADLSSGDKSSPIIPIQFDLCVNNTDDTDVSKFHRLGRGLANLPLLTTDISSKAKTAKIKIENLKFDFKIENLNQESIVAYICFKISQKSNLEKYLEDKLISEEKIEPEIQQPPNLMYSEGDSALPDFEEDELNVLPSSSSSSSAIKEINKIENPPDKIIKPTIPSLPIKSEININPDKILPSKTKTSTVSTRRQSKVIEVESVEIEEATPYDDESESILLNEKKTDKKSDVSKDKMSDQKAVKTNGGGNVGTVRALKELAQQREKLEKALNDIKKYYTIHYHIHI
jgi:WD40 repeat protein